MLLIFSMSIMGSIATILFLITEMLFKTKLSILWKRIFLLFAACTFLFPFSNFMINYRTLLQKMLFSFGWYEHPQIFFSDVDYDITNTIVQITPEGIYNSDLWIYKYVAVGCMIAIIVLIRSYVRYKKYKKYLLQNTLIRNVCIKHWKNIPIYKCSIVKSPCVVGVLHPIIVLPDKNWKETELSLIIEHELIHICHYDNHCKIIFLLVIILHFYNPLAYFLLFFWNKTSELYCDKTVINNKSQNEIELYGTLILDLASTTSPAKKSWPLAGLNLNVINMKERIITMKKNPHYNVYQKIFGCIVFFVCIFITSLTVLAYEPKHVEFSDTYYENVWVCEISEPSEKKSSYFSPNQLLITYNDGSTMYISESDAQIETFANCLHSYQSCTIKKHDKKSDGSCYIYEYNGKICTKCHNIILEELINVISSLKCTH